MLCWLLILVSCHISCCFLILARNCRNFHYKNNWDRTHLSKARPLPVSLMFLFKCVSPCRYYSNVCLVQAYPTLSPKYKPLRLLPQRRLASLTYVSLGLRGLYESSACLALTCVVYTSLEAPTRRLRHLCSSTWAQIELHDAGRARRTYKGRDELQRVNWPWKGKKLPGDVKQLLQW